MILVVTPTSYDNDTTVITVKRKEGVPAVGVSSEWPKLIHDAVSPKIHGLYGIHEGADRRVVVRYSSSPANARVQVSLKLPLDREMRAKIISIIEEAAQACSRGIEE